MQAHSVVSRDDWLKARTALLAREKDLTRRRDALAAERRALPWLKIEKTYVFEGPDGSRTLSDLFAGRSQLFVKHFMMAPGATRQCVGCSLEVDHFDGLLPHLENHDVSYVAIARAPIAEIEAVRRRMGWRFAWLSSHGSDFNYDFNVSFRPEEMAVGRAFYNFRETSPGMEDLSGNSVFYKNEAGDIFLTFASFGRGGEALLGIYGLLDMMPKGRDENGPYHSLADWARPKNRYGASGTVEPGGGYREAACDCAAKA